MTLLAKIIGDSVMGGGIGQAAHPESNWPSYQHHNHPAFTSFLTVPTSQSSVSQPASSRPVSWPVCDGLCPQVNFNLLCSKCKNNYPTQPVASQLDRLLYFKLTL